MAVDATPQFPPTPAGSYKLWAWLWYTDCHGYQEPAESLDYIFSRHEEYFNSMKKPDHCYMGQRLRPPEGEGGKRGVLALHGYAGNGEQLRKPLAATFFRYGLGLHPPT